MLWFTKTGNSPELFQVFAPWYSLLRCLNPFSMAVLAKSWKLTSFWHNVILRLQACSLVLLQHILRLNYMLAIRPQSNMVKNLPKMLLGISQIFYLLCSSCSPLYLYYALIWTTLMQKFYYMNVLLEYLQYKNESVMISMHFSAFWKFYYKVLNH